MNTNRAYSHFESQPTKLVTARWENIARSTDEGVRD